MVTQKIKPAPDSHYRLLPCTCGGEAEYLSYDTGLWAVRCTHCGRKGRMHPIRHAVQVAWNTEGRA